ncbi:oxygen-dependent tRNA uridine(34) hydroxylase TrhO [Gordonia liuliyuniae]|uniref:tRNA uridine(34) hydroxylase n=1 Tax=Gordonia liuliyuniae TaxID=2911517 RepID=A0ABS9IX87_9ACTN|nr:rhodanese-related sulfurtransferase [Gordonia liuliyuniae]MCF8590174.1 rhodanese-related sulfurtransferase [Gordonia liuliyuniae]
MATPKIVLFYVFTPLPDPEAVRLWQHRVCESLGLHGRIIVSSHGINATVGGDIREVKQYVRATREYTPFRGADIKWSDGVGDDFPRLTVKVRSEIVTFGAPDEVEVDANGIIGGGTHLNPDELHALIEERGGDVAFLDGRNAIEAQIGRFRGAIVPDVETTRDFIPLLESGELDHLKHKPVVTYCTGGVRCEVLTAIMRHRGFTDVYQLDGGIVRYGERFADRGLWEGSLYVFDKRMSIDFGAPAVIGRCAECQAPTSRVVNHPDRQGRELAVVCEECVPTGA